jgi:UMF1 family MFS transporter
MTAAFFGVFALPCFFLLKERKAGQAPPAGQSVFGAGFTRLAATFRDLRQYRELFKFLLSFFLYSCGIATVISFAAIFAQEALHFTRAETIVLIVVANATSAAGAFLFGFVQDRIGAKATLLITLVLWLAAVLGAYFVRDKSMFWAVANVVGIAVGASQSASRSMVGLFSPVDKSGEFFGFWGFAGKGASIVGLFSFGAFLKAFGGNMRPAILVTSFFFLAGMTVLFFVDPKKGEAAR